MEIRTNKIILLTGAGFTHNFGAPLADQLSSIIFNNQQVQTYENVRKAFIEDLDFESVYQEIMEGVYSRDEKEAMKLAITHAYNYIDDIIVNWSGNPGSAYPVNINKVQKLINAFCGTNNEPGVLFTLNQDLFLEHKYYNFELPHLPGISPQEWWFKSNHPSLYRDWQQYLILPSKETIEQYRISKITGKLLYIKLHGSCNWMDAHGQKMVIGGRKIESIEQESLLAWYLDIFQKVFTQANRKLLVIGYSFGDDHINKVLSNAVINYGLKVYIISPSSQREFGNQILQKNWGKEIWEEGLKGYYPYRLSELFPSDQSESTGWHSIQEQFFEQRIS